MSKKISLKIDGKSRPSLSSLFKKYISRKMSDISKRTERYYELFPFLVQWGIDEEDAEMLLRYYGYIDKDGNVVTESSSSKKSTSIWDEEDYWDEYEEIYPGNNNKDESEEYILNYILMLRVVGLVLRLGVKKKVKVANISTRKGRRQRIRGKKVCSISPSRILKGL